MNDLEKYFAANVGGAIHKWKGYFEIYERHLSRYRGTDVHVLEIGVLHGGSLQMWKQYFGPDARIYGVDVNPHAKDLEEAQVEILIGDQADRAFLEEVASIVPRIDILIDDGGHRMKQQKTTFDVLFPHVHPHGVYVCEDLHTSYWAEFGGGYRRRSSYIEYSKQFIDWINAWHSRSRKLAVSDFTRSVHGLHYYDSLLVMEKRPMEPPSGVQTGVERLAPNVRYGRPERAIRRLPDTSLVKRTLLWLRRLWDTVRG